MKVGALFLGIAAVAAVLALPTGGCTKPNPNVCCVTDAQCADLGADELRPCRVGQACAPDFTCVAAECSTNDDCSADAPICRLGFCESTCAVEDDCAGVAGRTHCSSVDGTCVECIDSSQCSGAMNICDAEDHACRGCKHDDECTSGVCIEADGVCADENRVAYVGAIAGHDTGDCPKSAPCSSISYAFMHMQSPRDVVHVAGSTAAIVTSVDISKPVIIDATNTVVGLPVSGPAFTFSGGNLLIENANITAGHADALLINGSGGIHVFGGTLTLGADGALHVSGGSFTLTSGKLALGTSGPTYVCEANGQLTFDRATVSDVIMSASNCAVRVTRSSFSSRNSSLVSASGGQVQVENSLFAVADEFSDAIGILNAPNSTFRFNTVVSTSTLGLDAIALTADANLTASSNIFAYNSSNPIQGNPVITHSLFDTAGAGDAGSNTSADSATFFVDPFGGDFHLATSSPAIGGGEGGLVNVDIEGKSRPASMPDIGAYEAP